MRQFRAVEIALVIFRAEPERGGAEQYVHRLGHALLSRGHQVSVLASKVTPVDTLAGVKIPARGFTRTGRYRAFLHHLERHLATTSYDIVHACLPVTRCDVYHAHAGLEATSLREGHRIKSTLAGQATAMLGNKVNRKRRAFAAVEASLLNGPNPPVTICLSDRERRLAARMFPSSVSRLVTLHSAPDDTKFSADDLPERRKAARKSLGLGPDRAMYLFIGQDFRRKGLATAIRAMGRLNDPHAVLYVLGEGDLTHYSKVAASAGVVGRVCFAGSVGDVPKFMAAADALVLPTRYEPFGMVVVEAMLMGVPPIVSGIAGASEVIDQGKTGFVVANPDDIAAWGVGDAESRRCCHAPADERRLPGRPATLQLLRPRRCDRGALSNRAGQKHVTAVFGASLPQRSDWRGELPLADEQMRRKRRAFCNVISVRHREISAATRVHRRDRFTHG